MLRRFSQLLIKDFLSSKRNNSPGQINDLSRLVNNGTADPACPRRLSLLRRLHHHATGLVQNSPSTPSIQFSGLHLAADLHQQASNQLRIK